MEETPGHTHTALCYGTWELTCELTEHTHTDECREAEIPLPDEEPAYICNAEEHIHDADSCYTDGELTCQVEEHIHTEECLKPEDLPENEHSAVYGSISELPPRK